MKKIFRKISFLILFFLVVFGLFSPLQKISSETQNTLIFLAEIEGEIKAGTLRYFQRVMEKTEREKALVFLALEEQLLF